MTTKCFHLQSLEQSLLSLLQTLCMFILPWLNYYKVYDIVGASVSEPHNSEFNGIYIQRNSAVELTIMGLAHTDYIYCNYRLVVTITCNPAVYSIWYKLPFVLAALHYPLIHSLLLCIV